MPRVLHITLNCDTKICKGVGCENYGAGILEKGQSNLHQWATSVPSSDGGLLGPDTAILIFVCSVGLRLGEP